MINIEILYDDPNEKDVARQLVNELEDRLGDYPANVWMDFES
jgi:hypothetical protein